MKHFYSLLLALMLMSVSISAQNMMGITTSNYAGTHSVIANPANVADTRQGFYFNVMSGNGFFGNTMFFWDGPSSPYKFFMNDGEFEEDYLKETNRNKPALANVGLDLRGPSFLLKLNDKSGIAIHTRTRVLAHGNNVSEGIRTIALDDIDLDEVVGKKYTNNTFTINANAFSEIGFTYGRTVWESEAHFIKAGATVKRLIGSYSAFAVSEQLDFGIQEGADETYFLEIEKVKMKYGYSTDSDLEDEINPFEAKSTGSGWGFDIGVVYEFRPHVERYRYEMDGEMHLDNSENKYLLSVGVSLLDMGSIKYNSEMAYYSSFEKSNFIITEDDLDDLGEEPTEVFNDIFDLDPATGAHSFKTGLPTALRMFADYRIAKRVYANFTLIHGLRGKEAVAMRKFSQATITPRIEMKWFELAMPISMVDNYSNFALGASIKLGPLFLGSDNLGGAMGIGTLTGVDVYAGLALPLYKGKIKDKDKDGISNKKDKCKKIPGLPDYYGCPDETAL